MRQSLTSMLRVCALYNLAAGTNAWTDTDHTVYTLTTAEAQGFLSVAPVMLDHILFPTLTESSFITEVHHITKAGDNSGVVYNEVSSIVLLDAT
jgi:Zn-dependent M16 (insulinase) family peptidase